MPIILNDLSGLSQGIQTAGSSIAGALEKRAERRLQQQQGSVLDAVVRDADFSTPEGTRNFLIASNRANIPIKDSLAIIKQFSPSQLDKLLESEGYGTPTQQQEQPVQEEKRDIDGLVGNPVNQTVPDNQKKDIHPALRDSPYNQISDEKLAVGMASKDPSTRDFSKNVIDSRNQAFQRYDRDRKYAHVRTKKYFEKLTDERGSMIGEELSLSQMRNSFLNRSEVAKTRDFWSSLLMKQGSDWAERFLSPEGAIVESAVKSYLIDDLAVVKGRPNQFLEQRIISSLPGLMKSDLSNLSLLAGFELKSQFKKLKVETSDRLEKYYMEKDGHVPENFESIVYQQIQPSMDSLRDEYAYKLRTYQEKDKGVANLANKKVVQGTPLTLDMMTYLVDEHGKEKAIKRAKKLGYTIPTLQQYKRYDK